LTNKASIDGVDYWIREVKDNGGVCPIYIVGSKSDNKKINADFNKLAKEKEGIYMEVSSKNGEGVDQLMEKIVNDFKWFEFVIFLSND